MSSIIDTITTADFKTQFPRFIPVYIPTWVSGKTYFKGEIVFYTNNNFYLCKKQTGTTALPTVTADWSIYRTNVLNYTRDEDITHAMEEAKVNFNESLYGDNTKLIFLYLTAFYLTLDFTNATGNVPGLVSSKTVGSVSESYIMPQWVLSNPTFSMYASNGYGRKYLRLITPYITGNIILFNGATTID